MVEGGITEHSRIVDLVQRIPTYDARLRDVSLSVRLWLVEYRFSSSPKTFSVRRRRAETGHGGGRVWSPSTSGD